MSIWSRIERGIESLGVDLLSDDYRDKLETARKNLVRHEYLAAEKILQALCSQRPDHDTTAILLGTAQLGLGRAEQAAATFDRVLKRSPNASEALIGRGEATLALSTDDSAAKYFRAALNAADGNSEGLAAAYRGLGACYQRTNQLNKAIRELRKAVAESKNDVASIAALGEALIADTNRSNNEARRHLERLAKREKCPPAGLLALGRIALDDGDLALARRYFRRVNVLIAHIDHRLAAAAHAGVGEAYLRDRDGERAEEELRASLSKMPRDARVVALLADALALRGKTDLAMKEYERSLAMDDCIEVAKRALAVAVASGEVDAGVSMANRVLAKEPNDAVALTARGIQLAIAGNTEAARATYEKALAEEAFEPLVALGNLELAENKPDIAVGYALRALRLEPRNTRARELLVAAQTKTLGVALPHDSDWYELANAIVRLCKGHPSLAEFARDATTAVAEHDQPLLVAVMGEFSSGKSSFVNAFIQDAVAPTGITPTTATINVVKYGSPGGRIVFFDETSRDVDAESLSETLSNIDEEQARRIRHVEIYMPLPVLERVNIIDTPGLNSIVAEHETVARAFLKRADAVIWLFAANQAGKRSEQQALDRIHQDGIRVLGVLNKVDQLEESQIREVVDYMQGELGDRIEICVPVSARAALDNPKDPHWQTMNAELDSRFFQMARQLKRQALNRRIVTILSLAQKITTETRAATDRHIEVLNEAGQAVYEARAAYVEGFVREERVRLGQSATELMREAAVEVLELVRPRKLPFGEHRVEPADRDYLLNLLDSRYEDLLEQSRGRAETELGIAIAAILAPVRSSLGESWQLVSSFVDERLRLMDASVFGRCSSFLRGYIRGGYVHRFFEESLPKLELSEDAIYRALLRGAPDIDAEMTIPLAKVGEQVLADLGRRLLNLSDEHALRAAELDAGVHAAVLSLEARRRQLMEEL